MAAHGCPARPGVTGESWRRPIPPMVDRAGSDQAGLKPRLIIVTGVSGSGRATALRVLEDLDFYCVDNLPVALAPTVIELVEQNRFRFKGVALGVDARERLFFPRWPDVFADLERAGIRLDIIFLDASDEVLARRYQESRRPHPLAESGLSVADSIRRERLALAEMRERASRLIDTSTLTVHELREIITAQVMGQTSGARMAVAIVSFGYKYGLPLGLDLMFDVRFLPNPFFVPELKQLSGLNPKVRSYLMEKPETERFLDEVTRLLEFLLPLYRREGKSYLTIGLGCTGGRHRSPMLADELGQRLSSRDIEVSVRHHDVER
jgi:UPF0042 nucleotide-binding protein